MANLRSDNHRRPEGYRVTGTENQNPAKRPDATGKHSVARKKKRRKSRRRRLKLLLGFVAVLFILGVIAGGLLYKKYGPGHTWADLSNLYPNGAEGSIVICNGQETQGSIVQKDTRTYYSYSIAQAADSKWYLGDQGLLLYTYAGGSASFARNQSAYNIGGVHKDCGYPIWFMENDTAYISADFMKELAGLKIHEVPQDAKRKIPARLFLDSGWKDSAVATIKKKTEVRQKAGVKSPILTKAAKGANVTVLGTLDNWTKIRSEDGFVGYVKTKTLKNIVAVPSEVSKDFPEYTRTALESPVKMAFHQTFSAEDNQKLALYLEGAEGLNVICPTWLSVSDNLGNVSSLGDRAYVDEAHARGLKVWGLISDFDANLDQMAFLSSTAARTNAINQIGYYIELYGLDGINVDFEGIKPEHGAHFIQFIRELSNTLRRKGKVLSIDNYPPTSGRVWYDLSEQGVLADYVVIMEYDEHYKGSEPGTNASANFTEYGISSAVEIIPKERVVCAYPFFMRLWWESPSGKDSKAIGIREAWELVNEKGAKPEWKEDLGQYYAAWTEGDTNYQIWLEDVKSLELKMKKVEPFDIGGMAFWKLGLESEDVWSLLK